MSVSRHTATEDSPLVVDQVFSGNPMPGIAGLEEVTRHCVPGSERALWDEVPGVIVNDSKRNAACRIGNERESLHS
jgi:hypothetical protein